MSPYDIPQAVEHRIEMSEAQEAQRKALDEAISERMIIAGHKEVGSKAMAIRDHGQIQTMKLEEPFGSGRRRDWSQDAANLVEFGVNDHPEVKLGFFYRGMRVDKVSAEAFKKVLEQPPHQLTAAEIGDLKVVLRNKGEDVFSLSEARTEDINGRRVLVVEGRYTAKKIETRSLYVDSDGTGSAIQEIYYQAPGDEYQKYLPAFSASLASIKWK